MRFENVFCGTYIYCRFWCSTKVDNNLEHIGGQGNWGFCRQSCPTITSVTTTRPTTIPRPTTAPRPRTPRPSEIQKPSPNGVSSTHLKKVLKIGSRYQQNVMASKTIVCS